MEVNVCTAKARLSRLIDRANAGEEEVITRHGRPVARLVPADRAGTRRKLGLLEGQGYWIAEDFDAPRRTTCSTSSRARARVEAAPRHPRIWPLPHRAAEAAVRG